MTDGAAGAVLVTPRLRLRRVRPAEDLPHMHAVLSDPRAMAYWSSPPHASEDETRDWLAAMAATTPAEGDDFILEHEGRAVGKAGFYRFPEIGYILAPALWGRGLAREALGAVIPRAFALHRLPRIEADVDPRNIASIRLLEALGFAETGRAGKTWLIAGQWCDSVYFSLTPEAWAARTA